MKKAVLITLLAAVLLTTLMPVTTLAESPESDFTFNNGTLKKYNGSDTNVIIPPTINGQAVTAIGNLAFYESSVKSVVIPDSVTSIGNMAFYNCKSLESIIVPSGVTSIGTGLFWGCSSLKSASFLGSIPFVAQDTFRDCRALESVLIPSSVKSIDKAAFYNCSSLRIISVPKNVTSIGDSAFYNCTSLIYVDLPQSVTSIEVFAFSNCPLKEAPDLSNVKFIGARAFSDCAFTDITIPAGVEYIEDSAFQFSALKSVTFEGNPVSIHDMAFFRTGFTSPCNLYLPESWKEEEPKAGSGIEWKGGTFNVERADSKGIIAGSSEGNTPSPGHAPDTHDISDAAFWAIPSVLLLAVLITCIVGLKKKKTE